MKLYAGFRDVDCCLVVVVYFPVKVFGVFGTENGQDFSFATFEVNFEAM